MSAQLKVEVDYLEVRDRLNQLPQKLHNKVLRTALRRSTAHLRPIVRSGTPSRTGAHRKGVHVSVKVTGTKTAWGKVTFKKRQKAEMRWWAYGSGGSRLHPARRQPGRGDFVHTALMRERGTVRRIFDEELARGLNSA